MNDTQRITSEMTERLQEMVSPEAWKLYLEIDSRNGTERNRFADLMISELVRHFRWPAPAVNAVLDHLWYTDLAGAGTCCEGETIA
jgi:hypothetical protein